MIEKESPYDHVIPDVSVRGSPLIQALQLNDSKMVKHLVLHSVNVNSPTKDGCGTTALHLAASLKSLDCLIELLQANPKPLLLVNRKQETALHVGARFSTHPGTVLLLVAFYGVNSLRNLDGETFFHVLMQNHKMDTTEIAVLMKEVFKRYHTARYTINILNNRGKTVYDVAVQHQATNFRLLHLLLQNGALSSKTIRANDAVAVETAELYEREAILCAETQGFSMLRRCHVVDAGTTARWVGLREEEEMRRIRIERKMERKRERKYKKHMQGVNQLLLHFTPGSVQAVRESVVSGAVGSLKSAGSDAGFPLSLSHGGLSAAKLHAPVPDVLPEVSRGPAEVIHFSDALIQERETLLAARLWLAFRRYKRHRAAVLLQKHLRGYLLWKRYRLLQRSAQCIVCVWRRYCFTKRVNRRRAVTSLLACLRQIHFKKQRQLIITNAAVLLHQERIKGITRAVTQLLWRENFFSAFFDIVFKRKRGKTTSLSKVARFKRWLALSQRLEKYLLLAQVLSSLFFLVYRGFVPRTTHTRAHNDGDVVFICLQIVVACFFPLSRWRIIDLSVFVTAVVCAICKTYGGTLLITLMILKLPFAIQAFVPQHPGTRTYCMALEYSAFYLMLFSPFALAGAGVAVRGAMLNDQMLTSRGNWGRVFLYLCKTLSPQYTANILVVNHVLPPLNPRFPVFHVDASHAAFSLDTNTTLVRLQMPLTHVSIFHSVLFFYTLAAIIVGAHGAVRIHYDMRDETNFKMDKHHFKNVGQMELLETPRAANMETLGAGLDGATWEASVRAVKHAMDTMPYDHNAKRRAHQFVHRVRNFLTHDSRGGPYYQTCALRGVKPEGRTWDCRNEDPISRGTYDVEVIKAALGKPERKERGQLFFERQWVGTISQRETTLLLFSMLVMAFVKPNNFPMEAVFSSVFIVELVLSMYFLRLKFIFSRRFHLIIRLFCAVVGFIPSALPFVAFRGLRLCEGWSTIFVVPRVLLWSFLYGFVFFLMLWMIAFVAALQLAAEQAISHTPTEPLICQSPSKCLVFTLREMIFPLWTSNHTDTLCRAPLTMLVIFCTHFLFIPFFLTIVLHPLLQLSSFIGRFLRLVVHSLHKDVIDYLDTYLEGSSWYFHYRTKLNISYNIITKLKMWVRDFYRKGAFISSFVTEKNPFAELISRLSFSTADNSTCDDVEVFSEIICRGEFTSFAENAALDSRRGRYRLQSLKKFSQRASLHYMNLVLTIASIVMLWYSSVNDARSAPVSILAVTIHIVSIAASLMVFPKDLTAILTFVSLAALLTAVIFFLLSERSLRRYYYLRYISLLRLGQLQIYIFSDVKCFVKMFTHVFFKTALPALVVGSAGFVAELLRAQIYLTAKVPSTGSNWAIANGTIVQPEGLTFPEILLFKRCCVISPNNTHYPLNHAAGANYTSDVISCSAKHVADGDDVLALFAYYLREDAYIFYFIFSYWMLPALCISICLSYLYWSGANLQNTHSLLVNLIPLLEDPITVAGFKPPITHFRWVGNVVLILGLVFNCIFSPSTGTSPKNLNFFFGFELTFATVGLVEGAVWVAFSAHRCGCAWIKQLHILPSYHVAPLVHVDAFFLFAEIVQLVYYAMAVPLCITLLRERHDCLFSLSYYTTYFMPLRFVFLLRLLPRQHALFILKNVSAIFFSGCVVVVYFIGSASAIADLATFDSYSRVTPDLWRQAFVVLIRQTFTSTVPQSFSDRWVPLNMGTLGADMISQGLSVEYVAENYMCDYLTFILATIGKMVLVSITGLEIAVLLVPLRTQFLSFLPPKSSLLYFTLCGGLHSILRFGELHDDMRPETRRKAQRRKLYRIFTDKGIPSWCLPHLLEELNICRPARQRRFMFVLEKLLLYLPIREKRQHCVKKYMKAWDLFCGGAPVKLNFSLLPVFSPKENVLNPLTTTTSQCVLDSVPETSICPLRLVQALAFFELGFPADSSVGSKLWLDFFSVVQKMRGATLMQSLWRMYRAERDFETNNMRTIQEKVTITTLRRSFQKYRIRHDVRFRSYTSFTEALRFEREVFNPGTCHYDVLSRLRRHYSGLQPTKGFIIRNYVLFQAYDRTTHFLQQIFHAGRVLRHSRGSSFSLPLRPIGRSPASFSSSFHKVDLLEDNPLYALGNEASNNSN